MHVSSECQGVCVLEGGRGCVCIKTDVCEQDKERERVRK